MKFAVITYTDGSKAVEGRKTKVEATSLALRYVDTPGVNIVVVRRRDGSLVAEWVRRPDGTMRRTT